MLLPLLLSACTLVSDADVAGKFAASAEGDSGVLETGASDTAEPVDLAHDRYSVAEGDCNDADSSAHPGTT